MSLYDYFQIDPPITCLKCGGPAVGWKGTHSGDCCLFVWNQGQISPSQQKVSEDLRLDDIQLSAQRLPNEIIPISGGECLHCGIGWHDSEFRISADSRSGRWTNIVIDPPPLIGNLINEKWLQCPQCADAYKIEENQFWLKCEPCGRLVQRRNH